MELNETQQALLQQFDLLAQKEGSANKAAARIGVNAGAVSSVRKGTYAGNVDNVFERLKAYFETKTAADDVYSEIEYAPTTISERVYQTIKACKIKGGIAIATGDAGIGKTKAIAKFYRDNPLDCIVITANPCCRSAKAVLKLIAMQLNIPPSQSTDDLYIAILAKLHDGMCIIIDEGQLLTFHSFETVRAFSDYFAAQGQTLGVALIGNNGIRERIEGKTKEAYRQINNRTWQRPAFVTSDVKLEDIKLLFPVLADKQMSAELTFLHKIAQTAQGVRGAVRLFSNAYDNENYTLSGLAAMAKAMRLDLRGLENVMEGR